MHKVTSYFFNKHIDIDKLVGLQPQDIIIFQFKDGILLNNASKTLIKEIKKYKADFIYCDEIGSYKPNWSPDTLRSWNYISGLIAFSGELFLKTNLIKQPSFCAYDLILRLTENAKKIIHTDKILFAADNEIKFDINLEKKALNNHLIRIGLQNFSITATDSNVFHTRIIPQDNPLVSILIPNCDHIADLHRCITSILDKSSYKNYEIIIIENNSKTTEIFDYYNRLKENPLIKIFIIKEISITQL